MSISTSEIFKRTTSPVRTNTCFVLMPFREEYDEIYQDILKPLFEEMGYHCLRADEIYGSRSIVQDIWEHIQTSGLIVADMTGRNPNVFYELGLSHATGKNVILITQSIEDVPFDLRHLRCIVYKHTLRGLVELREALRKTVSQDSSYSKIPLELLSDKFLGGFTAERIALTMKFDGFRGQKADVEEKYRIVPTRSDTEQFYKKLQVDGKISEGEVDRGLLKIRTIFPGMYLISVDFPEPLKKAKEAEFTLRYSLEDCFGSEAEFWFYNIEVTISLLQTTFHFPKDTDVRDFKVFSRVNSQESLFESQAKCLLKGQDTVFVWEGMNLTPPNCCVFRWAWK